MMQQLISGSGSLMRVPLLLTEKGCQRPLLIAGNHFTKEDAFKTFTAAFGLAYRVLHPPDGLLQIASVPVIDAADAVIAVGGGKALDFAKGIVHQWGKPVYFVAVPTTAGSGSEATPFAVFYSGREKVSIDHPHLLPQTVVLDPSLLKNLPPKQKAVSGADAFSQCIESVWNLNHTAVSDESALSGLEMFRDGLQRFVQSTDEALALKMLRAAHLSGKAIAGTRTTGPHALSYYLTAHHEVPHGQAVALFLPLFFLYNKPGGEEAMVNLYKVLRVTNADEAAQFCRAFFSSLGLATTFSEAGLKHVDVDALLRSVNQQRFANNPVAFDAPVLEALIRRYLC